MSIVFAAGDTFVSRPRRPCGTGVLVLAGSSGRLERDRAELFSRHGATALAIRWFGGTNQRPTPHEVPLETFFSALDLLAGDCDRLAVIGTSFGAEAALLTAVHDRRVAAVVAVAPTSVAWEGYDHGDRSSHWTLAGQPVPYVPFLSNWEPSSAPPAYRPLYEQSLAAHPARATEAAIRVEMIGGEVVLVAGEDDQVWPSAQFARDVAARRALHGLATTLITHPQAGHRVRFPSESVVNGGQQLARGGSAEADAALGALAWPHVAAALRLDSPVPSELLG